MVARCSEGPIWPSTVMVIKAEKEVGEQEAEHTGGEPPHSAYYQHSCACARSLSLSAELQSSVEFTAATLTPVNTASTKLGSPNLVQGVLRRGTGRRRQVSPEEGTGGTAAMHTVNSREKPGQVLLLPQPHPYCMPNSGWRLLTSCMTSGKETWALPTDTRPVAPTDTARKRRPSEGAGR